METQYARAERVDRETIQFQNESMLKATFFVQLFNTVSDSVMILNKERQIIFFNDNFLALVDASKRNRVYGRRPGEALQCVNALRTEGGCGTSVFCRECGFLNAVLTTQNGQPDIQECRINRHPTGEALDLRVRTSQISVEDNAYTVVSLMDISNEKRRRVLERLFFHDIMNTAVALRGLSELLGMGDPVDAQQHELARMVHSSAEKLVDEIQAQKDLTAAENNEYQLRIESIDTMDFLNRIVEVYRLHEVAADRFVQIDPQAHRISFNSDATLLFRVIANMTKNALEASGVGDTVTLGCLSTDEKVQFRVHNRTYMPPKVQRQVFLRSYSTKGIGRGLGTYSIKLLSERYLKGEVWFTSSEQKGTTFYARYPLS